MNEVEGGVTRPKGFKAVGAHVGLKRRRKDLALIWSEVPACVAGAFTRNVARAAPIIWNERIVNERTTVRGVAINSGNANSLTGSQGLLHAEMMAQTFAALQKVEATEILIASTGLIGVPLPIERIKQGIETICPQLSSEIAAGKAAAEAIMTTDSYTKEIALSTEIGGKTITFGGMAKGSGMIHPNMATMLSFVTTDANISPALLRTAMQESVGKTYNMISVDGDTSTNDMVAVLANGLAGNDLIIDKCEQYEQFLKALNQVNLHLAKAIVNDGEGATKFLEVTVRGTSTLEDARKLARAIVSSNLVKTAFFGEEANWGWILAAMGYGGVPFDPAKVSIHCMSNAGRFSLVTCGQPANTKDEMALNILKERSIKLIIDLQDGESTATAWGCDLSYEYVRINGTTRT